MQPLHPDAIKMLVVHCSDTPDNEPLRAIDIQQMHLGFGWDGIGYHYVIGRDGRCEAGRPEFWQGAHVRGINDQSLGVCLIGRTISPQNRCTGWSCCYVTGPPATHTPASWPSRCHRHGQDLSEF